MEPLQSHLNAINWQDDVEGSVNHETTEEKASTLNHNKQFQKYLTNVNNQIVQNTSFDDCDLPSPTGEAQN